MPQGSHANYEGLPQSLLAKTGCPTNNLAPSRPQSVASKEEGIAQRSRASSFGHLGTPVRPSGDRYGSMTPTRDPISKSGGVRAMAAMFEVASKESPYVPTPMANLHPRVSEMALWLSQPRLDTLPPKNLRPKGSSWSFGKISPGRRNLIPGRTAQTKSHHHKTISDSTGLQTVPREVVADETSTHLERPFFAQNWRIPDNPRSQQTHLPALTLDNSNKLPSLGTMVQPQEQPPIAQHVSFPRPPSSPSVRQTSEDFVSHRTGSPGGNSVLHRQTRTLQKQLDAKTEEAVSLRRQLDTREDLDVGTLSEQLRAAKRECAMWKARAEAAEKRVAALERFTRRLRGVRGGDAQADIDMMAQNERGSTETTGTEDGEIVANRIKRTMKGMDGTRSSDGGAAAWWNEERADNAWGRPVRGQGQQHMVLTEAALREV